MARYSKITKKADIKTPDEFLTFWDHAYHYVIDHKERLMMPVAGVLVALVLGFGFYYYQTQKEAKANEQLYRVLAELPRQQSGITLSGQEMIDKLKAYDDQYGGSNAGRTAKLYRANIHFQKGNYEDATALYRQIGGDDLVGQYAAINLAASLNQQGKYAEAAAALEKLRDKTFLAEEVDYQIARNQEAAGNTAAAKGEYARFMEKHPESGLVSEVKERLNRL